MLTVLSYNGMGLCKGGIPQVSQWMCFDVPNIVAYDYRNQY